MHPTPASVPPIAVPVPPLALALHLPADEEFALGCECANPCLQIEDWRDQPVPAGAVPS